MKLNKHAIVLLFIVLFVVVVLSFVLPFSHTVVFWIALLADLLMFAVCACVFVRAFRRKENLESKLLGWPLFKVVIVALAVQVVVGFAMMALSKVIPVSIAVIAEVLIFAATGVLLIVRDAAMIVVENSEQTMTDNTAAWKAIRSRAAGIAAATGHPELKKLAETIRYADPTPTEMDGQVAEMLETLSSYADAENIRKAFVLLEQRKAVALENKQKNA